MKTSISNPPKQKLCPTCWNVMRLTADGYVCPRHGLRVESSA